MNDHMLHGWQCAAQLRHHTCAVQITSAIGHAVASDQHLGRDLLKTVQHGIGTHVRCAQTPHAANAHRGQKCHRGFGCVGQVGGHAVARLDAVRT